MLQYRFPVKVFEEGPEGLSQLWSGNVTCLNRTTAYALALVEPVSYLVANSLELKGRVYIEVGKGRKTK